MKCIKKNNNISSDWNGTAYCGLTFDWDYKNHTVDLSLLGYIKSALHKYQHPAPARPEHAPHTWNPPIYGAKTQFVNKTVKLPQPQLRTRTYTQTVQNTLRATQVRAALSHAYAVTYQNRITDKP
jgi:hypothetical protein